MYTAYYTRRSGGHVYGIRTKEYLIDDKRCKWSWFWDDNGMIVE